MSSLVSPKPRACSSDRRSPAQRRRGALRAPRSTSAESTRVRRGKASSGGRTLVRYCDWRGRSREVVTLAGAAGSLLVLDRDACTHLDRRVLAHLAADEPAENALLVSRCFVRRAERSRCRCRRLTTRDLREAPPSQEPDLRTVEAAPAATRALHDGGGHSYRLSPVRGPLSIPELRWCRDTAEVAAGLEPLSVRDVIASLERYGPVLAVTQKALSDEVGSCAVSVATLRAELVRVQKSPIVLNRGLRAATLAAIERHGLSMSEIAMRCGRVKHDAAGNASGETSWLARRLGLLPEGGRRVPTPWIHSDVLALIARDGLGLSPFEVEAD